MSATFVSPTLISDPLHALESPTDSSSSPSSPSSSTSSSSVERSGSPFRRPEKKSMGKIVKNNDSSDEESENEEKEERKPKKSGKKEGKEKKSKEKKSKEKEGKEEKKTKAKKVGESKEGKSKKKEEKDVSEVKLTDEQKSQWAMGPLTFLDVLTVEHMEKFVKVSPIKSHAKRWKTHLGAEDWRKIPENEDNRRRAFLSLLPEYLSEKDVELLKGKWEPAYVRHIVASKGKSKKKDAEDEGIKGGGNKKNSKVRTLRTFQEDMCRYVLHAEAWRPSELVTLEDECESLKKAIEKREGSTKPSDVAFVADWKKDYAALVIAIKKRKAELSGEKGEEEKPKKVKKSKTSAD